MRIMQRRAKVRANSYYIYTKTPPNLAAASRDLFKITLGWRIRYQYHTHGSMRWNKVVVLLKIWFIFQFCVELLHLCALKFYIFVMYCKRVRFCWVINFSRLLQHVFKKPCHDAFKHLFVGDIISHNKIVSYARHKSNKTLSIKTWLACMPRIIIYEEIRA